MGEQGRGTRSRAPCPAISISALCPGPELNALQEEFEPFGLVILGFPCNQFGKQEPGDNSEILSTLR